MVAILIITSGCVSIPKETVELSEVTGKQITELHKSHIRFIELYYGKLRDDVNNFIDTKWTPLFLSKAVDNNAFRNDLDAAYVTSNIKPADISITWKGSPLKESQKRVLLLGVEKAVTDEKSKLGKTLLEWSEEAQSQINIRRQKLLKPVDEQEKMVINEINGAFLDLQRSQAAIKGYLASAVELKQKNDEVLKKLGALKKVENVMNVVTDANGKLSSILQGKESAKNSLKKFMAQIEKSKALIKKASGFIINKEEEK